MEYGPFHPSSLVNEPNGNQHAWTIASGKATVSLPPDGTTDFLKATGFSISVPSNKVITEVRLQMPDMLQGGKLFNNSDEYIVGSILGDQQAYASPPYINVESDSTDGLTPAVVNDSTFGFKFSIYNGSGAQGTFDAGAMALTVITE